MTAEMLRERLVQLIQQICFNRETLVLTCGHPQSFDRMDTVYLAVNGTLMRGLELSGNMELVSAHFVREAQTEPTYRLWSINDRHPAMMRVNHDGAAIALEIWAVPAQNMGVLLLLEPPGLCIGKVRLSDGEEVLAVLGEPFLCEGKRDITQWGGWRAYIAHLAEENCEKQGVGV